MSATTVGREPPRLIGSPGRSRSSRSSCGSRRGSGTATSRPCPPASAPGSSRPARSPACRATRRPGCTHRWPWTWNVWKSSPIESTSHWTSSPTFARKTGVLPTNARPLIVLKPSCADEVDDELAVRRGLVPAEDRERAEHAALDRLHHRRRVVVVRPDARGAGPGLEPVGERLARLDVRARPREAGDERAVRAEPVAHAVEVHRVRVVRQRVEVPEVDEDRVADTRAEERSLQPRVAGAVRDLLREVLRELAVDDRAERPSAPA